MADVTRRAFVGGLACSLPLLRAETPAPSLSVFRYDAVELLDGPLKRQFDENHEFFLNLSEDRLLKIYRQRTGLPAPGENMGGWYDIFSPGAHFGQYVSALARFACATKSEKTRAKVVRLLDGYAQTVDPSGKFFVDLRYPAYTYDKLVCGLIDAYSFAGYSKAGALLQATTRAALPHIPERALTRQEQSERPHKDESYTWDESYTLAENLFLAYERFGDRQYFDLGKRYLLDRSFFDPLSQGKNVLTGMHAYSHANALSSGMQGYLKLGDPKYFRAVTNAVQMIWDQSYATGGWGPNEAFVEPGKGLLGASLSKTRNSFETPCGSYAHFKVMRYLLACTQDSRYGDSLETVLYNTVLGAKPIQEDGSSFYYSDYHHSGRKIYKQGNPNGPDWDRDGRWPCCSGTLPQVAADYLISTYFRGRDGVYVNLFVPSRLTWTQDSARCTLTQQTDYPRGNLVTMHVDASSPVEYSLHIRVPAWAGDRSSLSVNGKRERATLSAGTFAELRRTWKRGDIVELELDQRVRTPAIDRETPNQIAIVRGPQVLFAIAEEQPQFSRTDLARMQLEKGANHDWKLQTEATNLTLRPFADIHDEIYQTYSKVIA